MLALNVSKLLEAERVFSLVTKSHPFIRLGNMRANVEQALGQIRYYSIVTNEFVAEPDQIMSQDVYPFPQLASLVLNLDPNSGPISEPLNFLLDAIDKAKESAMEEENGNGLGMTIYRETIKCHSFFANTNYFSMLTEQDENNKRTPVFVESKMVILKDWMENLEHIMVDIKKVILFKAHIEQLREQNKAHHQERLRHMIERSQL